MVVQRLRRFGMKPGVLRALAARLASLTRRIRPEMLRRAVRYGQHAAEERILVFSDALEVAIGMTFVLGLISLVMTAVAEYIESWRKTRGKILLEGVIELLDDTDNPGSGKEAARAVYGHPLVQGLYIGDSAQAMADHKKLPSYLPANNFALALIDKVLTGEINAATSDATLPPQAPLADRLRLAAERVRNAQLRRALLLAAQVGGSDLDKIRKYIEDWFNAAMDRTTGRYKRKSQKLLFWLGLAGALLLNVNALTIADALSKDATLRRAVVAQAEAKGATPEAADAAAKKINELGLPIGWTDRAVNTVRQAFDPGGAGATGGALQLVLGYLLTALAVSLGAPFWFDLLKRLMVVRSSVKPAEGDKPGDGAGPAAKGEGGAAPAVGAAAAAAPSVTLDRDIYASEPAIDERPFEEWH
jgi:hypothetical protein